MKLIKNYKLTFLASYIGYFIQAIVINFAPLLFVTFQNTYNISLSGISSLIIINFSTQLAMDFLSSWYVDKLGYRKSAIMAHIAAIIGIAGLSFLPDIIPGHYFGLAICMVFCGIGGGTIEVIISPIIEALPTKSKSASMSILHSFYSWGQLITVLLSTAFFAVIGIKSWRIIALIWAIVPLLNGILFSFIPVLSLEGENEKSVTVKGLLSIKFFWIFLLAMVCSGAAEQAIIQWASVFAESGLNIGKTAGDLFGPCMFALLMGIARVFYALFHEKIKLLRFMLISAVVLLLAYLLTVFAQNPIVALSGCALCGLAVGIMWPGTISLASRKIKGGTAMFAMLAFSGDAGCITGPGIAGYVSDMTGGNLRYGFLAATVFPLLMLVVLLSLKYMKEREKK